MKMYRKRLLPCFLFILLFLTACGKQVCDYCGEEKYCTEYDILGTTRWICDDCLNDPERAISGNIIKEYSELYENGTLSSESAVSTDTASSDEAASANSSISMDSTVPPAPTPSADMANSSTTITLDSLRQNLNDTFASLGYTLLPTDETNREMVLYQGNTDLGIHFVTSLNGTSPALSVQNYGQPSSDFTLACIYSSLVFLNSNDYSGLGYQVYNNACQYGNYTYDNIRFYYMENTNEEIQSGSPCVTFDISM